MMLNRTSPKGLKFQLDEVEAGTKIRLISKKEKSIIVPHPISKLSQSWYYWQMRGDKIQDAFFYLNVDEREFLITGLDADEMIVYVVVSHYCEFQSMEGIFTTKSLAEEAIVKYKEMIHPENKNRIVYIISERKLDTIKDKD